MTLRVDSLITAMRNANTMAEKTEKEQEVYDLSKSIGYNEGLTKGKLYLLNEIVNLTGYDHALKLIDDHMDEALKLDIPSYTIELLTLKANCYSGLGLFDESRTVLNQAKSYALKLKDNNEYHQALGDIYALISWNIEEANGNLDSVLFYLKKSKDQYVKLTIKSETNLNLFGILHRIGMVYFEKKQYDSAEKYLPYIYQVKEKYMKNFQAGPLVISITDARLKYIRKDYRKSLAAYQSALDLSITLKSPDYQKVAYDGMAQVYAQLDDKKNEAIFLEKYANISDSLNLIRKKEMRRPLENIVKNKDSVANTDKNLYILVIAVSAILILSFLFLYRYKKRTTGQRGTSAPNEIRHKPLSTHHYNENDLNDLIELAKQNSPILRTIFNEFDHTFCKKLLVLAPNLLITEQELCIYIKLNFDTKEIARYTRSSVKAVQARKYRIRKKLNIPTKEDITNWIINL
ncbi:tetratricopeptide repeat protein [Pedobacter cryoconitis]|uniref:Tetratricopeptide (TPR) repeat protein n=1 Tax=Pedobacter cryoconitis TaxID=188932 RepID=A0A7X0J6W5_9SPHI|nr:hypothetical protein [Pedobacter cryoconitis]MBB6500952.1 tetratricopeptide (TPR) repeat protein [Pedobacter cryoconitis]